MFLVQHRFQPKVVCLVQELKPVAPFQVVDKILLCLTTRPAGNVLGMSGARGANCVSMVEKV